MILHQLAELQHHTGRIEATIGRAAGYAPDSEKSGGVPAPDALLVRIGMWMDEIRARLEASADRLERIA